MVTRNVVLHWLPQKERRNYSLPLRTPIQMQRCCPASWCRGVVLGLMAPGGLSCCPPCFNRRWSTHELPPCRAYELFSPKQVSLDPPAPALSRPNPQEHPQSPPGHCSFARSALTLSLNKRQYLPLLLPSGHQQLISVHWTAEHCVITLHVNPMCQWAT